MEAQLKELLEKIKKDGINAAEEEAGALLKKSQDEAKAILEDAKKQAEAIIEKAKVEKATLESSAKEMIKQASRDLILNLENQINRILKNLTDEALKAAFNQDVLVSAIENISKNWKSDSIEVMLNDEMAGKLKETILGKLGKSFKEGIEIKPSSKVDQGFRIGEKDGSFYFDFTSDALTEMISQYLNPMVKSIIREE